MATEMQVCVLEWDALSTADSFGKLRVVDRADAETITRDLSIQLDPQWPVVSPELKEWERKRGFRPDTSKGPDGEEQESSYHLMIPRTTGSLSDLSP